jgi:ferrous iron transport protein B
VTAATASGEARRPTEEPHATARPRRVVVVGNPNVGKTTLFNLLARENARVGNYPGVTVERRVGRLGGASAGGPSVEITDVPGAYSLSARSAEEQIALNAVLGLAGDERPDLAVVVVDAGQLVRNLYLVLQLVELRVPCVVALNMIDEAGDNAPRADAISKLFGVPCVATSGRTGYGVAELAEKIRGALVSPSSAARGGVEVEYPPALRPDVDRVAEALPERWRGSVESDRALGRWALTSVDEDDELESIEGALRERVLDVRKKAAPRDIDHEIIGARYAFLDRHAPSLFTQGTDAPPARPLGERLDGVLIHPVYGFLVFLVLMMVMFQSLFTGSSPAIRLIEWTLSAAQGFAVLHFPPGVFRDLLVQGVLGGVGNVVVFVPQIMLLFLFIGLLEDSGYMARVAYLMDRVMRALGLHGRAFVPMFSGFACAIPAILATRTMERRRDRLLTMLVIPLMTCSARLPVYTLIIAALFPPTRVFGLIPIQGLLMIGMYLFATVMALVAAAVLGRFAVPGRRIPLILELPPYRLPELRQTLRMMWEKARSFLTDAGTTILACTVVLWVLLSYPKPDHPDPGATPASVAEQTIRGSYAGRVGRAIEPAIAPLGFDWKIGVGLIGAFAAREVFVSTMGLVYGEGSADEDISPLRDRMRAETRADGRPAYRPLTGLSLMVFFAIACQCVSTLVTVRRETKTWRWPLLLFAYTGVLAWTASFVVYQGGRLLGL